MVLYNIYILWMYRYLGELLVLHGLQRFSLCPLNIIQIILMVLRPGDHGLEESVVTKRSRVFLREQINFVRNREVKLCWTF
jgi:hypothetical protein